MLKPEVLYTIKLARHIVETCMLTASCTALHTAAIVKTDQELTSLMANYRKHSGAMFTPGFVDHPDFFYYSKEKQHQIRIEKLTAFLDFVTKLDESDFNAKFNKEQ